MSDQPESFDPYHRWLGISPKDQPPNHYRLLAIDLFESDQEVIRDAVARQMAHVRTYQLGRYMELSQKLLNEIAVAKTCLTDPDDKAAYDDALREALKPAQPIVTPQTPAATYPPLAPCAVPTPASQLVPPVVATQASPPQPPPAASATWTRAMPFRKQLVRSKAKQQLARKTLLIATAIIVVLLLGVLYLGFVAEQQPMSKAVLVLNWPEDQREGATLTIDNTPIQVKAHGPLEFRCALGDHHIVAKCPGMRPLDKVVAIRDRTTLIAKWEGIAEPTTPQGPVTPDIEIVFESGRARDTTGRTQPMVDGLLKYCPGPEGKTAARFRKACVTVGYYDIGNSPFTLELVVRCDQGGRPEHFAGWHTGGSDGAFFFGRIGKQIHLAYHATSGHTIRSYPAGLESGKWYHLALVRDHKAVLVYVNGQKTVSAPPAIANLPTAGYPLMIGNEKSRVAPLNGELLFVRIYRIALTQQQVEDRAKVSL